MFVGTDTLDPVEKVVRVAGSLPVRPFLMRKRNGNGACHVYLRFARGRGRAQHNTKGCCYLGSLTPLQLLAARQAIDRAWPRRCRRPKSEPFQTRLRALRLEYRTARQRLTVLARRAGYYLHGLSVRKMTMTDQKQSTKQDDVPETQESESCAVVYHKAFGLARETAKGPSEAFEQGLYVMERICMDLIALYAGGLMEQAGAVAEQADSTAKGRLLHVTKGDERAVIAICRLQESCHKLGEARLRLRLLLNRKAVA